MPNIRKEVNKMPSPVGEGQTDTPINHAYLGEVPPTLHPQPRFCAFTYKGKCHLVDILVLGY